MTKKNIVLDAILKQGTLPLFFYKDPEVSLQITRTLYKAGIRVFEYTNRGAAALENFKVLKQALANGEMPGLELGIGTIKSVQEAEAFIAAGTDFIVSPIVNPEVGKLAAQHNLLWIPGCMTPTEIYTAQQNEAALIKIFPANILGPEFVSSIRDLFAGQLFIPTGGVDLNHDSISTWFKAGVCAVGMGSKLISKSVLENQEYDRLYNDTLKLLEIVQTIK
ncbi:bifunctional 4-hydroxy-2-oxoglutarate aldolase/2-dehydro-3-deoxy-phosphogluconate aldolase [Mucilaginibacter rubeus]|uniref:Bifunctional 4-hydroxy-2-oxoglutarate aldolase/2-dehydro-3-deoxy-phosphogluconate aldolase n=1 Tax=Mucilaginibacter rubeus TaxID=2027860 RepID=A0AAE6JFI5_9SPHI|nr:MULTISPECIES: bifunctional 4-hydroxy-2-oxoglutarate aldolase/2-dehydro-3-deoxy-phosphogluconate aldolase [Mucilaginibacter]QEM03842.1 bifunctional 4-hydroxy-2-oxoglutarate aldolase/2-dehydro-3-deoxy-phosphogluconate aldolase [Mucilaginibacter rubeus]QEM16452.1 bifunctional 4-hydroxy-2-oxoglutarate aldolase/2-dehydro-3-deoxy-phosphogluconate aldolase [Mucilaginibacter gossypii]QTE40780.1 bifunctional 4-hydroxy-2-oxoglutarate aldolase/2-dehydro-3-deoxy-phosphogluconate aldolase [Mucilaginibacte